MIVIPHWYNSGYYINQIPTWLFEVFWDTVRIPQTYVYQYTEYSKLMEKSRDMMYKV